jgi:hypothetical protein
MSRRLNRRNVIVIEGVEHKVVLNDGLSMCEVCSLNYLCDDFSSDNDYSGSVPCSVFKNVLGDVYFKRKDE